MSTLFVYVTKILAKANSLRHFPAVLPVSCSICRFMWPRSNHRTLFIGVLLLAALLMACWAFVCTCVCVCLYLTTQECFVSGEGLLSHLLLVQKLLTHTHVQPHKHVHTNLQEKERKKKKMAPAENQARAQVPPQPSSLSTGNCKRDWIPIETTKGLCSCI